MFDYDTILFHGSVVAADGQGICSQRSPEQANPHIQGFGENISAKWLYQVTGRKKLNVLLLMIVQALNGGSGVLYALLLRNIVDSATDKNLSRFRHYVILTLLLVLCQVLLHAVIRFLQELSHSTLENLFKKRLLSNILYKDFSSVSALHSGEWLNRLTNDLHDCSKSLCRDSSQPFRNGCKTAECGCYADCA